MSNAGLAGKGTAAKDATRHCKCYKLLVDPAIVGKGSEKLYRYDGKTAPGAKPVTVHDPRGYQYKANIRGEALDLPVPRFKYDHNSVGTPPARDVFLSGLNDNSNDKFLRGLCQDYGEIERLRIYRHPSTKKHLGLAKIGFGTIRAAKAAITALDGRSVMGKIIKATLDPKGEESRRAVQAAISPPADASSKLATTVPPQTTRSSTAVTQTSFTPTISSVMMSSTVTPAVCSAVTTLAGVTHHPIVVANPGGVTAATAMPSSFVGGMTMLSVGGQSVVVASPMPIVAGTQAVSMFPSRVATSAATILGVSVTTTRGESTPSLASTSAPSGTASKTSTARSNSSSSRTSSHRRRSPSPEPERHRRGHRESHQSSTSSHRKQHGKHSLELSQRRHDQPRTPPSSSHKSSSKAAASATSERQRYRSRSPAVDSGSSHSTSRRGMTSHDRSPVDRSRKSRDRSRDHSGERSRDRSHDRSSRGRRHSDSQRSPSGHHSRTRTHRHSPVASSSRSSQHRSQRRSRSGDRSSHHGDKIRKPEQPTPSSGQAVVEPISPPSPFASPPPSSTDPADTALSQLQQINSLLAEARESGDLAVQPEERIQAILFQPSLAPTTAATTSDTSACAMDNEEGKKKLQFAVKSVGRTLGVSCVINDAPSPPSPLLATARRRASKETADINSPALSQSSGYGSGETPSQADATLQAPPPPPPPASQPPPLPMIDDISPAGSPASPIPQDRGMPPLPASAPISPVPPPPPPPADTSADMEMSSDDESPKPRKASPVTNCAAPPPAVPVVAMRGMVLPRPPFLPPGTLPPPPGSFLAMPFPFPGGIPPIPPPPVGKLPPGALPPSSAVPVKPPPPVGMPPIPVVVMNSTIGARPQLPPPPLAKALPQAPTPTQVQSQRHQKHKQLPPALPALKMTENMDPAALARPVKIPPPKVLPEMMPDISPAILSNLLITSGALVKYTDCVSQEKKALADNRQARSSSSHNKKGSRGSSQSRNSVTAAQEVRVREILRQGELLRKEQQAILDSLNDSLKKRAPKRPLDEKALAEKRGSALCHKVQQLLAAELQEVVKKDIRRKLLEGTAFRMLGDWQEKKKADATAAILGRASQVSQPVKSAGDATSSTSSSVSFRVRGYHMAVDDQGRVNQPVNAPLPKFLKKPGAAPKPLDSRKVLHDSRGSLQGQTGSKQDARDKDSQALRFRGSLSSMVRSARSDLTAEQDDSDESDVESADEDEEDNDDDAASSSSSSVDSSDGTSSEEEDDEDEEEDVSSSDDDDITYAPNRKRPRAFDSFNNDEEEQEEDDDGHKLAISSSSPLKSVQEPQHPQHQQLEASVVFTPEGESAPDLAPSSQLSDPQVSNLVTPPIDAKDACMPPESDIDSPVVARKNRNGRVRFVSDSSEPSSVGMPASPCEPTPAGTSSPIKIESADVAEPDPGHQANKVPVTERRGRKKKGSSSNSSLLPADFNLLTDAELIRLGVVEPSRSLRRGSASTHYNEHGIRIESKDLVALSNDAAATAETKKAAEREEESVGVTSESMDVTSATVLPPSSPDVLQSTDLPARDTGKVFAEKSADAADPPAMVASPTPPADLYSRRTDVEELAIEEEFVTMGLDSEDLQYLLESYSMLKEDEPDLPYASQPIAFHPPTLDRDRSQMSTPRKRGRPSEGSITDHKTGCARSEGYYKITKAKAVKARLSSQARLIDQYEKPAERSVSSHAPTTSSRSSGREHRAEARRQQAAIGFMDFGALSSFHNQLQIRHKRLKFSRSPIHDWGLYAMEFIAADEMVIEYVGERIRALIADRRERNYEKSGIGSSYLFRVDGDCIIDATKTGNVARFVNHSCQPNCYAKIITVGDEKRIVIYSKHEIQVGQEITYDYKFPLEDDKIPCLCGAPHCRGFLN